MTYTKAQQRAIETEGKNIIVSAGAGSGKTGVLQARVIWKLEHGIHIDELVILTFTNAAAFEMKTRIIDAIKKRPHLKEELQRINRAIISTFDAFCLQLVKQYHDLLGLPETIQIGDTIQMLELETTLADQVIREAYRENDPAFKKLVLDLFQRGDSLIYETLLKLASTLQKEPNALALLDQFEARYFGAQVLEKHMASFKTMVYESMAKAKSDYLQLQYELTGIDHPSILALLEALDQCLTPLFGMTDFDQLTNALLALEMPRKPGIRHRDDLKESLLAYDQLKSSIQAAIQLIEPLEAKNQAEMIERVLWTKDHVLTLVKMTKTYLLMLEKVKREKELFSFGDIMAMAIRLFEEHEEIRQSYQDKIKEIMVDEYQDTNDLQEYFVQLIAHDNVFMVGDMKQSIYGFRDANPENFLAKYNQYKAGQGGMAIDLRENFRSRSEILDDINRCFKETMSLDIGGIDYQDGQSLIYGQLAYDKRKPDDHYGIDLIRYDAAAMKDANPEFDKVQYEAECLAKDIRRRIDGHEQVLDLSLGEFRDLRYSDIAILIDRQSSFDRLSAILSKYGVPVNLYSDEPFLESPEILFMTSYLKWLRCYLDDAYCQKNAAPVFYSVARSFVYRIPDETILHVLVDHDFSGRKDLEYLETLAPFKDLAETAKTLADNLHKMPLFELIETVYRSLDLFAAVSRLDNPGKKEEKLDYFALGAAKFNRFDLNDLIDYLELIETNREWDIDYSRPKSSLEAVKLMTMHKSKGLQFPIVYTMGLYKQFNFKENKDFFIFDKRYGLISHVVSDGYYPTFLRDLYLEQAKRDYISERIRLFYVALTRAKEHLVMILDESSLKEDKIPLAEDGYVSSDVRLNYRSYSDLIATTPLKDIASIPLEDVFQPVAEKELMEESVQPISHQPYDFQSELIKTTRFSKDTLALLEDEAIDALAYGDRVHHWLESVDFQALDKAKKHLPKTLIEALETLRDSGVLLLEKDPVIHQEMPFFMIKDGLERQGIIDLLVETEDEIRIIDYKLKSIDDDAYIRQLEGYKAYVSSRTEKPVSAYLFSLLTGEIRQIL